MSEIYSSLSQGLPASLHFPQFQAYIAYEASYRQSQRYLRAREFWQARKFDAERPHYYGIAPTTYSRGSVRITQSLGESLSQRVKKRAAELLAQGIGGVITLDMALFVLFTTNLAACLHRISGAKRLVIGAPFHNRLTRAFKNTLGLLMEVCPLHIIVAPDSSFSTLMTQVAQEIGSILHHYQYAMGNALQTRSYDVMVNFHNSKYGAFAGFPIQFELLHSGASHVSLTLLIHDFTNTGNLSLSFDFQQNSFPNANIRQRFVGHYMRLLSALLEDHFIERADLLLEEERVLVSEQINRTQTPLPQGVTLTRLFEQQVALQPDHPAAIYEGQTLSYAQLNRAANQLARHLLQRGVTAQDRIAICLERSPQILICQLAILKTGCAYVPLDPTYPPERLRFILEDAQVSLILTQGQTHNQFPCESLRVIDIEAAGQCWQNDEASNLALQRNEKDLAYVIYTSGSTGRPKGIMVHERGIVNNLLDLNTRFAVGRDDRVLCLSALGFDMCVYETLGMLIQGGTVVIPAPAKVYDTEYWVKLIQQQRVTIWNSVPTLLTMLVEYLEQHAEVCVPMLRLALLGGDWAPVDLPQKARTLLPTMQFVVMGGATELSIHSVIYEVKEIDHSWRSIPYGLPMANQQAYILDPFMQIVPPGISGELYLGGYGLAYGYFSQPDRTAERFLPHPYSQQPGERLYRTGDAARYMPDGTIELLGRLDHQIKLRGFRIEPGEIEAVLHQHPAVREAVVTTRTVRDQQQLVAYLTLLPGIPFVVAEIRNFLRQSLPDYMLPSIFVPLERLPVSPNGKVDRLALLEMPESFSQSQGEFVPPRTPLEQLLTEVWSSVLTQMQANVSIYDNFFDLGGQSLDAIQIAMRIREIFHLELLPVVLFEQPTIAELAKYLLKLGEEQQVDVQMVASLFKEIDQLTEEEAQKILHQLDDHEQCSI